MTHTHSGASELSQLMEGTTAGALIPEIVRRGFQGLLEAEVSALTGAQLHERCPDRRSTHRNGYRERLHTTQVGDLTLAIPKLRQGSFFPNWLEPRRRVDKALYAVVMEAYTGGISKSEVSRICQGLDEQVKALLQRPLDHARFPYVYLDATYLHGRLGRNMQVGGIEVEVGIAAGLQRPAEERLHLQVDVGADAAHLGFRDPALAAQSSHQGIDLAGGDASDVGLHHHRIKGLIHTAARLEDRWQEAATAEFRDLEIDDTDLGGEHTGPVAVAVAKPLLTALVAIGTEHSGDLQLDQLLQAVAYQLGDQLTGCAAIE